MSRVYLRPLGLAATTPADVGGAALGQTGLSFTACEVTTRGDAEAADTQLVALADWPGALAAYPDDPQNEIATTLTRLRQGVASFAGLDLTRPRIMGVINVTPDSFSDGGDHHDAQRAIDSGLAMVAAGADLLDIGGESTRPGAQEISLDEELARVLPVIEGLADCGAPLSIDSRHATVMAAALDAGAAIVNDVTALEGDPGSLALVAERGVPVVLMHMLGTPETMQMKPRYDDVALDIYDYLARRIEVCERAGIVRANIAVDPGIGFGKTLSHNLRILDNLALYHGLGCALVLGVSRKSFISRLAPAVEPKRRLPGSLAGALAGVARGVQLLRVHDVGETMQALAVWQGIGQRPLDVAVGA